jgi:nucleolar MIF4G domain-containing protein 1
VFHPIVLAHEPLRVSLEDLQSADTKGKWWLVGAAWGGDPLVDNQAEFTKKSSPNTDQDDSAQLTKLARAQGMNTDIRRGVFVVLMSSDVNFFLITKFLSDCLWGQDYIDARERLSQLKLTEIQQREIIRVLLHCCGNAIMFSLWVPYDAYITFVRKGRTIHITLL